MVGMRGRRRRRAPQGLIIKIALRRRKISAPLQHYRRARLTSGVRWSGLLPARGNKGNPRTDDGEYAASAGGGQLENEWPAQFGYGAQDHSAGRPQPRGQS